MENQENINVNEEATGVDALLEETAPKTYTAEEVAKLVQAETDRRTNQALAKQQKKFEKQLSLSRLDGDEREKAEKDARIAELEERLAQLDTERNRSELKSVLSSRGLSAEFADIINITDDIEASQANIDKLDKLFKAAVKAEVEKRIAGNAPRGNGSKPAELTRESVKTLSMSELAALQRQEPEKFNQLFGG